MPVLDQQQTGHAGVYFDQIYGGRYESQTFQAGITGNLKRIDLWLRKVGAPNDLIVEIRNISGSDPGSTVLATQTISSGNISTDTNGEELEITFSTPADIVSGTKYCVVIYQESDGGDSSNYYRWWGTSNNPYANGAMFYSVNSGSSWTEYAGAGGVDQYFQTYISYLAATTNAATNVSYFTATLNGSLSGLESGETAEVWFEYWKETESGESGSILETTKQELSDDGKFSANISSLEDGVTYHFQAKAQLTESGEEEKNGITISFTTLLLNNPVIILLTPTHNEITNSLLPQFEVDASHPFPIKAKFQLYNDADELIIEWGYQTMTEESSDGYNYAYKMLESDDYLVFGAFKLKVTVRDDTYDKESTQTNTFTIINSANQLEILSISRNFDGSSLATVNYRIKDLTESRVDLRFFLNEIITKNHCKLIEIQSSTLGTVTGDNAIKDIKTTTSWQNFSIVIKYNTAQELENVTNELKKSVIEVGNKIEITKYDGTTAYDISSRVKEISYDRNVDLGAKQLKVLLGLDSITNPYGSDPYVMYGNTIVLKQTLKVSGTLQEYTRFTGTISTIEVEDKTVNVTAYDDFKKFQERITEDLSYAPDKTYESREQLRTFDGVKFKSNYPNWAQFPPPEIYLGSVKLEPGHYQIDYYRGIVYIFRNVFLDGDWKERDLAADDTTDRKTFQIDYNIDSNSSLLVYHKYQEKVGYACVQGVEENNIWIDKRELYVETTDYIIDYENNKIILTTALPATTTTIRNHYIYVVSRAVNDVSANYYHMDEDTNEAEDIIRDIAEKAGFASTRLYKTITDEVMYSSDGDFYYTEKNNIRAVNYLKVNGTAYTDYTLHASEGKMQIDSPGLVPFDRLIDPIESTEHITINAESGDTVELSTSKQYGGKSVKCNFTSAGYVEKSYNYTYFRKDLENFNRFAVYLKVSDIESGGVESGGELTVTVTLRDNDGHSQDYPFSLVEDTWTKCICDISSLDWRDDICFVRMTVSYGCSLYFDYFFIPRDEVTIKYSYYTLQKTGTTINEATFFREDVDNALSIMEQVLNQCDPSYLVYVDEEGYLRGEYKKIRWSLLQSQVYKNNGFDYVILAGKFLLEDYKLTLVSNPISSISDEQIYTSILVCGKLGDRDNVALKALSITNNATWQDEAISYSKQGSTKIQNKMMPYTTSSTVIIKARENQEGTSFSFNSNALNDNDMKCIWAKEKIFVKIDGKYSFIKIEQLKNLKNKNIQIPCLMPNKSIQWRNIKYYKYKKSKELYEITFTNGHSIKITPEHKWQLLRKTCRSRRNKIFAKYTFDKLKETRNLEVGEIIPYNYNIPFKNITNKFLKDIGYMVGLFLAEGCYNKKSITYCLNNFSDQKFIKRLQDIAKVYEFKYKVYSKNKSYNISFHDSIVRGIIDKYVIKGNCFHKHINKNAWNEGKEFLKELLQGFIDGDGRKRHLDKGFSDLHICNNKMLIKDLILICKILNYPVNLSYGKDKEVNIHIRFNKFKKQCQNIRLDNDKKIGITRIRNIKKIESLKHPYTVVDINIDNPNGLFIMPNGLITHNSGVHWYMKTEKANDRPSPDTLMATVILEEEIYWEEIAISVGTYKNKTIRQEMYIKVGDLAGNTWFPEGETANKQNGNSGCVDEQTEVLTEEGWKTFKEIVDKQQKLKIATLNPKDNKVEYHYPNKYFKYAHNGKMLKQTNKFIDLMVTPNHKMWISGYYNDNWNFEEAQNLKKCYKYNRDFPYNKKKQKWFILPKFNKKTHKNKVKRKLLMDDFLKLLGIYLAEGCLIYRNGIPMGINIAQNNIENQQIIKQWIKKLGYKPKSKNKRFLLVWDRQLGDYFRQFGKANNKFIPRELLNNLSKEQCKILLDALILGDGHISKEGTGSYFTISKQLANNVQELSLKAGFVSSLSIQTKFDKSHFGNKPIYRVSICSYYRYPQANSFKGQQKKWVNYKGYVYCLTVPNHLMYVRRNGKCCWTGNSWLKWKNSYNKNNKINKILVYLSEPFTWVTSEAVVNSKK